jgi:hypothetical protein
MQSVSLFPACIALSLALHCGWDSQCIANAMGMIASFKLPNGSQRIQIYPF